ncbi:hypothetical protein H4R19_005371, partial [Coemansia spiralis]
LVIHGSDAILLERITYTRLTHLEVFGFISVDVMIRLIHRLPHLVSLHFSCLNLENVQTDFSIPECAEHEPMAPLDTQIRYLYLQQMEDQYELPELALSMLKYLLLRIPTLRSVTTELVPVEQTQAFIDEYVQWYPHLANIQLIE